MLLNPDVNLPRVVMVLYPDFLPIHFAMTYSVFTAKVDGKPAFDLKIAAPDKMSACGKHMSAQADGGLELLNNADIIIVPGWNDINEAPPAVLIRALQAANKRGVLLVGLCFGAFVLAYAGLLDGKTAATHWLGEADFAARFPQVRLDTNALYVEDGNIITSAGTVASLDCGLAIVRKIYDAKTANKIARVLVVAPHREGGQAQFIEQPLAQTTAYRNINYLLEQMRKDLKRDYHIDELAARLSVSRSSFTRRFRKATGMSVNQWLIEARLQYACDLLESSELSVDQIAEAAGFQQAASLRRHFGRKYKISPRQWRRNFVAEAL